MVTSTSALPGTTILNLPIALSLDGSEYVPVVQAGTTKRVQAAELSAGSIVGNLPYVMASSASGLAGARKLAGQGVIAVTDGGSGANITVSLPSCGFSVIGNSTNVTSSASYISGTTDQVLRVSSAGTALGFGAINLASSNAVSNILPIANGGTGSSSPAIPQPGISGQIAYYSSANIIDDNPYLTISSATFTVGLASSNTGRLALASSAGGTTIIQPSSVSATLTGPVTTTTLIGDNTSNTLTGKIYDTAGSSNSFRIGGVSISTASDILNTIGSSQGMILYRGAASWQALVGGSSVQVLVGGTVPQWGAPVNLTAGTGIALSPATITSSGTISMSSQRQTLPTITYLTAGTSATYTTPANCLFLEIIAVGGGGGGAGSGTAPGNGGSGGNTTFGTGPILNAQAGAGAIASAAGVGGTPSGGAVNKVGSTGQNGSGLNNTAGGNGGIGPYGGVGWGGAPGAGNGISAPANSGGGGGGAGVNVTINGGGGGGAGGYIYTLILNPLSSYSYTIGAGGTLGSSGGGGSFGGAGGSGFIQITEYYNS